MNTTSCFGALSPQKFQRLSCVDVDEVMNPAVELRRVAEPTDEMTHFVVGAAFRFQYFVDCEVTVAIVIDLLYFKAIKLAFYRFTSHVFRPVRGWVSGYARLNLKQLARLLLLVTFVEWCVACLRGAYDITRCEMPTCDRFFFGK